MAFIFIRSERRQTSRQQKSPKLTQIKCRGPDVNRPRTEMRAATSGPVKTSAAEFDAEQHLTFIYFSLLVLSVRELDHDKTRGKREQGLEPNQGGGGFKSQTK